MQLQQVHKVTVLVLFVMSLVIAACGGGTERQEAVAMNEPQASADVGDTTQAGTTVNVTLQEMKVTLDKLPVGAGTTTFVIQNNGHAPHDFSIQGNGVEAKTPQLQPGESATLTVDLTPGDYQYKCTIFGHAMAGMQGTLQVT